MSMVAEIVRSIAADKMVRITKINVNAERIILSKNDMNWLRDIARRLTELDEFVLFGIDMTFMKVW